MSEETCYCNERKSNAEFAKSLKDIPEGYCGICDICGKPGHMKAHPQLPTSGAWCDEHWNDLLSHRTFTLGDIFKVIWMFILAGGLIYNVINLFE